LFDGQVEIALQIERILKSTIQIFGQASADDALQRRGEV